MKQPLAIRIDGNLLAAARACARRDNRTLTNLIETVLRRHVEQTDLNARPTNVDADHLAQKDTNRFV